MNPVSRATLDQWRVFLAIIEQGGYAQAASYLHRSQSAVSYAMNRLQEQLGVPLLQIEGRKALLTDQGRVMLDRARQLLDDAQKLEDFAHHLAEGREAEIRLVVDSAFPNDLLMNALSRFARKSKGTRVQLREVVLSGASDALLENEAELVIGATPGFLGDPLIEIEFIAVACVDHPLHQLKRKINIADLLQHTHVVISDSGHQNKKDVGWLSKQDRWSVSSIDSALSAIEHGLGYGWLPGNRLVEAIGNGTLKPLPLEQGATYKAELVMSYAQPQNTGPATRELATIIKNTVNNISDE